MADTYNDLGSILQGINESNSAYEGISNYVKARESAAQFAQEEGDQTAAQILLDPSTPIEKVADGVIVGLKRKQKRLDDIVDNKFDEVIESESLKKDNLERSLLYYGVKKSVEGKYKDLSKGHNARNNLIKFSNRDNLEPGEVKNVLNSMLHDIIAHYEGVYKPQREDNDEVRKEKNEIKNFFLSLYIDRNGRPTSDGNNLAIKYQEINNNAIKDFEDATKEKRGLVDYVKNTIPEDKKTRTRFLASLYSSAA